MISRTLNLPDLILRFCRYLRQAGYNIGPTEEKDALLSLADRYILSHEETFARCLKSQLCKSRLQVEQFDLLYEQFWKEMDRATDSKIKEIEDEKNEQTPQRPPPIQDIKDWLYNHRSDDTYELAQESAISAQGTYEIHPDEKDLKEIFHLVNQVIHKIANRRSRRYESSHSRGTIDIRKSIRKNLLTNDEIIKLSRKIKKKNIRVVLLCDVSKSMDLYSRFFMQFMYAFKKLMQRTELFAFSTKLFHITEEISAESLSKSLDQIIKKVDDWSSGTRIGESLQTFVKDYGHRHLDSKTVVFILSDGWDTGDPELISDSMAVIHRRAMKVIWLNPLMQNRGWKPEVLGMTAAMPFIDLLLPLHNVDSIRSIVRAKL